ncbi:MAG: RNase adapter RapZ [Marmoricola sp.]
MRVRIAVVSFGFKYGIPVDSDLVADMRFLPNPYWEPELKELTGKDQAVSDFVTQRLAAQEFLQRYVDVVDTICAGYLDEGKRFATFAIGCTGGKHRSVAMAEEFGRRLLAQGYDVRVEHRDLGRE